MKKDRTELHDLAAENPDKVKALAAKWQIWAERAHITPYPGGEGGKKGKGEKQTAGADLMGFTRPIVRTECAVA